MATMVSSLPPSLPPFLTDNFHPALKDLDELGELPRLPLDQAVPLSVLSRRRHAISSGGGDSPYLSKPRMKRRGAISYDQTDASALYIRYLVEALAKRENSPLLRMRLPELPMITPTPLDGSRSRVRRGSIQTYTSSTSYRDLVRGSVIDSLGVLGLRGDIKNVLKNFDSWDFDIFALTRLTEGRPLFHLGLHLFQVHGLISKFNLEGIKLYRFLTLVEDNYHPDNSYHNSTHAADVAQALHCLISDPIIYNTLTPVELISLIIAALCHDLDHPGVNQSYLINTSSYLAAIHGTHSLLERHHCYTARAILKESGLLDDVSEYQEIIALMEDLILATDVQRHKDFLARFEEMLVSPKLFDLSNPAERQFVLMIAMKTADISNPARDLNISRQWSYQIMEEFFHQGDLERSKELAISYLCDRHTTKIPQSQSGFFEFCALPLFKAWSQFVRSPLSVQLCRNIIANKKYWDGQTES